MDKTIVNSPQSNDGSSDVGSSKPSVPVDRISELYNGEIFTERTQEIARARIHWMCSSCIGESVLDVGCSQGIAAILLAREGVRVTGIDIHPDAIAYARHASSLEPAIVQARLTWVEGDLTEFQYSDSFDTILLGEILEHQTVPKRLLNTAMRYLKPKGRIVITTPFGVHPHPDHKVTLLVSDIADIAAQLNLKVDHLDVEGGYIRAILTLNAAKSTSSFDTRILLKITDKAVITAQETAYRQLQEKNEKIKKLTHRLDKSDTQRKRFDVEISKLHKQIKEESAEQSRLQSEIISLKERVKLAETERARLIASQSKRIESIEERHRDKLAAIARSKDAMAQSLTELQQSVRFQVGSLLQGCMTSPVRLVKLPISLWRLRREALNRQASSLDRFRRLYAKSGADAVIHAVLNLHRKASAQQKAIRLLQVGKGLDRDGVQGVEILLAREAMKLSRAEPVLKNVLWAAQRSQDFELACDVALELERLIGTSSSEAQGEFLTRLKRSPGYLLSLRNLIPMRQASRVEVIPNRICYVLHNSLPYSSGGYGTRSHGLAMALKQEGYDVVAMTRPGFPCDTKPELRPDEINREDIIDGIHYLRTIEPSRKAVRTLEYVPAAADVLEARLRVLRPQFVMAASNYITALPALIAARRLGLPFIYEVRGLWEITRVSRDKSFSQHPSFHIQKLMEASVASNADQVFTLTEAMKEELVDRSVPADKIALIPNSCDPERFLPIPRNKELADRLGIPDGVPVIGYIGTFTAYEGLEDLAVACGLLKAKGIEFRLLLVGNENTSGSDRGSITEEVMQIASECGYSEWLIMPGRVPHNEVEIYYSLLDICPFPRKPWLVCEMVSPLKPLEALAMQKAVVVSSVRALAEMIRHATTGIIFDKGNIDSLASALIRLVNDPSERHKLGRAGREWIIKERTWRFAARKAAKYFPYIVKAAITYDQDSKVVSTAEVNLGDVDISEQVLNIRRFYEKKYGDTPKPGVYSRWDWGRISYALSKLNDMRGSILDVGVGAGQVSNILSTMGFTSVTGIDVTSHSRFVRMNNNFEIKRMSVVEMSFDDNSFDNVLCMEVLEHLQYEDFVVALSELRRVCRGRLIMTVPFEETEPLPRFHRQRFTWESMKNYWPNASIHILKRPNAQWALIEEDFAQSNDEILGSKSESG